MKNKKFEIKNQIMDTLSMNKLRGLDELNIYQMPKNSELIIRSNQLKQVNQS